MFQRLTLIGRLTRDPVTKHFDSGKSVTNFSVAVESGFGDNKYTTFFNCGAWNATGINVEKYTSKGSMVAVDGTVKMNERDDKQYWEVNANTVTFLSSKSEEENRSAGRQQSDQSNQTQSNQPPAEDFAEIDLDSFPI